MAGKSPRKLAAGKKPTNLKALQDKLGNAKDRPPQLSSRPRRFSLIYSSDSSLSDIDADSGIHGMNGPKSAVYKNPRAGPKLKGGPSNAFGKNGRLISRNQDSALTSGSESATASSDYQSLSENGNDDDEDDDSGDDDSGSSTSSDDDVDFVKLTAERKKNAMKQLNALKKGKTPPLEVPKKKSMAPDVSAKQTRPKTDPLDDVSSSELSEAPELSFNFKGDDGLKLGDASVARSRAVEDLGEEVREDLDSTIKGSLADTSRRNVDRLAVPTFSDSEESDYNIDQEAYFKSIADDNENVTGMDAGLETGDDDMAILDVEERNMVSQLEKEDQSSFEDSQIEEGDKAKKGLNHHNDEDNDEDDYDEDAIMSDFDMPFYEDPKFSNLYYYDGSDQPLTLSTSLPLVLNEEKRKREERRQLKRKERAERLKRRLKSKKSSREHSATPDIAEDEYVFGLFFQSDDEKPRLANDLESPLRRLSTVAISDKGISSDDEEYENILLDIAHLPTEDEDDGDLDMDEEESSDGVDGFDDDISVTNVFIDIDDLDPDGFYFHYDSISEEEDRNGKDYPETPDDHLEAVIFVDGESTDEDDTLPPPNSRRKIGTKAKEVVSANVVGLKPPKLGTWQTDNKPFSIIDGLSTKSLYPAIQQVQQIVEVSMNAEGMSQNGLGSSGEKEELTLNELLNMSELEDDDDDIAGTTPVVKELPNWYHKPSVPLSAFRNKGINLESQEDEYMLPVSSARKYPIGYIGSERTRRKIDKMKEYQRKKDEKIRKLKKKKKLLKIRRERQRIEKQSMLNSVDDESENKIDLNGLKTPTSVKMGSPDSSALSDTFTSPHETHGLSLSRRKSSVKGMGMEDIDQLLNCDDDLLISNGVGDDGMHLLGSDDADLLVSLAAPIDAMEMDDKHHLSNTAVWRRRNSIVEAAAENMRVTKNGLFSETALADLEEIIGGSGELLG